MLVVSLSASLDSAIVFGRAVPTRVAGAAGGLEGRERVRMHTSEGGVDERRITCA